MIVCQGDPVKADFVMNSPASVYESMLIYHLKQIATEK